MQARTKAVLAQVAISLASSLLAVVIVEALRTQREEAARAPLPSPLVPGHGSA